jgi:D-alanyl-lipoteichoic acid acyltransferase DltB (MBOAT superfamily)
MRSITNMVFPIAMSLPGFSADPFVVMCLIALGMYTICKCLSWGMVGDSAMAGRKAWVLAYFIGYAGMNPGEFFQRRSPKSLPAMAARGFGFVLVKIIAGCILVWEVTRLAYPEHQLLAGWIGMAGVVVLLHFGLCHLAALLWRTFGFNAQPIMRAPLLAQSVPDFWSKRWNLAFHTLASTLVFRPLQARVGARTALLATFLTSGIVHELVITVPARGGYGLPTAYFLLQGMAVLLTQSPLGKSLRLRHGVAARLFTWVVVAVPAYWLFPPVFIQRVILPFLRAIGAL